MRRLILRLFACVAALVLLPTAAEAQWYAGVYLGANHTHTADVTIDQPASDTSLTFRDVTFAGRPFASPQYYGLRIGRLVGPRRRFGVEIEFVHLKVIGETGSTFRTTGTLDGAPVDTNARMDEVVQQYAMTHGLNFLVFNVVSKRNLGTTPVAVVTRAGAGGTIPHAETTVRGVNREQYEYAGPGIHGAAGIEIHAAKWLALNVEYKLTAARPRISIAAGTGRTTSVTHQVVAGFTFGSSR
jgi:hypothetical protein